MFPLLCSCTPAPSAMVLQAVGRILPWNRYREVAWYWGYRWRKASCIRSSLICGIHKLVNKLMLHCSYWDSYIVIVYGFLALSCGYRVVTYTAKQRHAVPTLNQQWNMRACVCLRVYTICVCVCVNAWKSCVSLCISMHKPVCLCEFMYVSICLYMRITPLMDYISTFVNAINF